MERKKRERLSGKKTQGDWKKRLAQSKMAAPCIHKKTEREAVLELLCSVFTGGEFLHLALRKLFSEESYFDTRSRAFITRLSRGTLERYIQIDYFLSLYSNTPLRKMKPVLLQVLRLSVYQLLFLDKIPPHAAINEGLNYLKKRKLQGLVPFANAILRKIAQDKEQLLQKLEQEHREDAIGAALPEEIFAFLKRDYGVEETLRIAKSFLSSDAGFYIRNEAGEGEKVLGNIMEEERFLSGEVSIQDFSSQEVGRIAHLREGSRVLDCCSAPGGKACHMASRLKGSGMVYARDEKSDKLHYIEENRERLQLENMEIEAWDARKPDSRFAKEEDKLDVVLCDAPCSGLGVIGKKADLRLHFSKEGVKSLQSLQREILSTVQSYVKRGGQLIYSTCTLSREENEENRDFILKSFPFRLETEKKFLPGEPGDGFYYASFIRTEETGQPCKV